MEFSEGADTFVASVCCFFFRLPLHKTQNHCDHAESWGASEWHYYTHHHFNFPRHFSITFSWPSPLNRIKHPPHISMQQCQESALRAITHQGLRFYYFSYCLFFFSSCFPRPRVRNRGVIRLGRGSVGSSSLFGRQEELYFWEDVVVFSFFSLFSGWSVSTFVSLFVVRARVVFGRCLATYFLTISHQARQKELLIKGDALFHIFLCLSPWFFCYERHSCGRWRFDRLSHTSVNEFPLEGRKRRWKRVIYNSLLLATWLKLSLSPLLSSMPVWPTLSRSLNVR